MKKILVIGVMVFLGIVFSACQTAVEKTSENKPVAESVQDEEPRSEGEVERLGDFVGKSDHITNGQVTIEAFHTDKEDKYSVVLGSSFDFDGAPAPVVALGEDGYKKDTILGKLRKNKGSQEYEIPAKIDPKDYNEVWIWCTQFDVPLGVAKLK